MTMRRIATLTGTVLAGFVLAGCATATIEDAVPAGALVQSPVDSSVEPAGYDTAGTASSFDAYPDLNATPMTAAPQISEQQKIADRERLRARQMQIAAEGRRFGVAQDGALLGARAQERATEAEGSPAPNDAHALRRLADQQIEEALKEIEGR